MSCSYWHPDDSHPECESCLKPFTFTVRRHHCRDCGGVFCHLCCSKALVMHHRGFPKTKVRVCNFCAPYIEVRLAHQPEDERQASPDRAFMMNETFVKSFQSKRKMVAPEDAVHAGYRLNRILQKNEALFLAANDLFIRKQEGDGNDGPTDEEHDANEDDENGDAVMKTLRVEKLPAQDVARFLTSTQKEIQLFPTATHHDCMSILFENATTSAAIAPSFQRLKESLTSAHHVAVNSIPQELPPVVEPTFYY